MAAVLDRIVGPGVIVIIRLTVPADLTAVVAAAVDGGATAVEVTANTPGGLDWLSTARAELAPGVAIGLGTVRSVAVAEKAAQLGADFVVAPGCDLGVVRTARAAGMLTIPGAFTPTEVASAWAGGADLVKLFPASLGGPSYLRSIRGPLDDVPLVPTGGIDADNAADYIRAGAAAVAVGQAVVSQQDVADGQFGRITDGVRATVRAVEQARREVGRG